MRILAMALLAAGATFSPMAAAASGTDSPAAAAFPDLKPAEVRRLDFYVHRVLAEAAALAKAESANDQHAIAVHDGELRSMAGRYIGAAVNAGVGTDRADAYFQSALATSYTGRLPLALIGSGGLPSLRQLLASAPEAVQQSSEPKGAYVDVIREVGKQTFGN